MKKTVRIKTPPPLSPDSPTLIRKVSYEGHTGSPPPQSPVEGSDPQHDPFTQRFADELLAQQSREVIANTRRNSETATVPPPAAASDILNPFEKTLATLDPKHDALDQGNKTVDAKGAGAERSTSSDKPSFDVDSFTKMMSTGAAPPPAAKPTSSNIKDVDERGAQLRDDRDSTMSSNTFPSTSEPSSTSYADLSSATSEDESENEASKKAMSARQPPPPPRHKHGKNVEPSGPQTVTFADFDMEAGQVGSTLSRSSTRELPTRTPSASYNSGTTPKTVQQARTPPPPPLARRTSLLRSKSPRDSETSSINSIQPQSPGHEPPSPGLPKSTKAPPPPPSRRGGARASLPPDQLSTADIMSINSDSNSLAEESISTNSSSLRPAGAGPQSASRTSSGSVPTTSTMPPPPPPRRHRGSSKSSMEAPSSNENRRTSHEGSRRASGLSQVSEADSTPKPTKDILADLSAFQAEVDALRAESLRRAS